MSIKTPPKAKKTTTKKKTTPSKKAVKATKKSVAEVSTTDYALAPQVTPRDIATAQIWVMAAVLYFILAFYEVFYRGDWFAGVMNVLLGAIFTSFAWQNESK